MADGDSALPLPRKRRAGMPWRKDPIILERLLTVEHLHLGNASNRAIAAKLGVDEGTVRADLKRLQELWIDRAGAGVAQLRADAVVRLQHAQRLALAAAAFGELCERAVLFGGTITLSDGTEVTVKRDKKGSAQFRGNKSAAIGVYRQAVMDQAKVQGIVVDKAAVTDSEGNDIPLAELMQRYSAAAVPALAVVPSTAPAIQDELGGKG